MQQNENGEAVVEQKNETEAVETVAGEMPREIKDDHEPGLIMDEVTDEVLRLHLDQFQGPMDVLLYLIKAQEIDIFDIPIVKITEQYLRFLDMMREENMDVTGEFVVLAATLIQIKSRMLLPNDVDEEDEEELEEGDPREELVAKLLEYRQYRDISKLLASLEEAREQWFSRTAQTVLEADPDEEQELLEVTLYDLTEAFRNVLRFMTDDLVHMVSGENYSVDEKIEYIEQHLEKEGSLSWMELFRQCRCRVELVCCFLAILELCRMGRIRAHQHKIFDDIRLFPGTPEDA